MSVPRVVVPLLVVIAIGASCAEQPEGGPEAPAKEGGFPVTFTDDEGVETTLESRPDRIITFAPSHTEIVFSVGLQESLVGVSGPFDDYPPQATKIEQVAGAGGVEPNIEKVVSLEPDVVLTGFIGGQWKDRLRELDISVFTTLAKDLPDAIEDIETIGTLLGVPEAARAVAEDIRGVADEAAGSVAASDPVTCFLDLGDLFTVGPGALEFDLLERAGCQPVTGTADEPYPQWSLEQLVEDDPEVYLVSEGPPLAQVVRQQGVRDLTAVREGRVQEVNPDLISRPGPRLAAGISELAQALHGAVPAVAA